jgi:methyl-accepting chemotaxis protein
MNRGRRRSLAFVCTVYTALVIAGAMAVYAVYQYFSSEDLPAMELVIRHSWHMLLFVLLIYLTLSLVLYRKVVRPVRLLNVKLYAISRGDLSPVEVRSGVKEVREIAEIVNFLLMQMGRNGPGVSLSDLSDSGENLRQMAHELDALEAATRQTLVGIANMVEEVVERLSRESVQRRAESGDEPAPAQS